MSGDRIAMSQRGRDRMMVMSGVLRGERTQVEAARLLKRSVRQIRRIQRRLEAEGDAGVIHRQGRQRERRASAAASVDDPQSDLEHPGYPEGGQRLHGPAGQPDIPTPAAGPSGASRRLGGREKNARTGRGTFASRAVI